MSQRGTKLRRIRRLIGAGVPAAGVTRVSRPAPGDADQPGREPDVILRPRGFGFYRGAHRRAA